MTWVGLERYGYLEDAQRLAYRWLYMCVFVCSVPAGLRLMPCGRMTTAFVDFNGVVPEKFDAVRLSHLVDAEYGNQGIDFKMVPREGFGWMNGVLSRIHTASLPSDRSRPRCSCLPSWSHLPLDGNAARGVGLQAKL